MLINCVAYQNGRKLADIRVGEIHLYIHEPDCFVWVALADPDPAELEAMQREFGLHELAVEDARDRASTAQDRRVRETRLLSYYR